MTCEELIMIMVNILIFGAVIMTSWMILEVIYGVIKELKEETDKWRRHRKFQRHWAEVTKRNKESE